MSDLIKRLRNPPFGTETSERNLFSAAAAEIEHLTAERDAARAKLAQYEQAPVVGWVSPTEIGSLKDGYDGFMRPSRRDQWTVPLIARPEASK